MDKSAKRESKNPGTQGFFPWSPRTAQNLIINPGHITAKRTYNTQKPLLTTNPNQINLTSKVQEISIDHTWFKRNDQQTNLEPNEEARVLTEKGDGTGMTRANRLEVEEVIEKKTAKDNESRASLTLKELEYENVRSVQGKYDEHCQQPNAGVYYNKKEFNDERLNRIEQLILPKENLSEFAKSDNKPVLDRKTRPVPHVNHTNYSSSVESTSGPDMVHIGDRQFEHSRSDSCTTSVCSTCSLVSTIPSRSRCSSGDGCSSVECDGAHKTVCVQSEGIHRRNYTICYLHSPSCTVESVEPLQDNSSSVLTNSISNRENTENLSPEVLDCSCDVERLSKTRRLENRALETPRHWKQHNYDGEDIDVTDSQTESRCIRNKRNSVSEMQLMLYVIKLQTSKYGELKSLIEAQQVSLTLQGQSINRLVQCVMLLSVKLHQQTSSLDCLTKLLKRQELERRGRQTVVITTVLGLVVIYMLHLESVHRKITAIFRMFGITRQLKSFRRIRRMVSEIWRDIPPLLTNFWRIFIFKGRTD